MENRPLTEEELDTVRKLLHQHFLYQNEYEGCPFGEELTLHIRFRGDIGSKGCSIIYVNDDKYSYAGKMFCAKICGIEKEERKKDIGVTDNIGNTQRKGVI